MIKVRNIAGPGPAFIDPIRDLLEEDFGFFPMVRRFTGPAMDMYQTDKDLVVELQAPKVDPSKINVSVEDGVLKIEVSQEEMKDSEGKEYFRREIRRGGFARMISLPVPVKEDATEATFENGVLKITMPKTEARQPKKVEIRVK